MGVNLKKKKIYVNVICLDLKITNYMGFWIFHRYILTYAVVVILGLSKLEDKEFIKAFQVTDSIIKNNQPIFIFWFFQKFYELKYLNFQFLVLYSQIIPYFG